MVVRVLNPTMKSDVDNEIAGLLNSIGLHVNVASILTYLRAGNHVTQMDIVADLRLRQPEVSKALNELVRMDMVTFEYVNLPNEVKKGRPTKSWYLTKPFSEVISQIESIYLAKNDRELKVLSELKAKMVL